MAYELWYWPQIQGRGEFVRLALEAAGIEYEDCARLRGAKALLDDMEGRANDAKGGRVPFAPPYLVDGITVAQVANILQYLAERHDLQPSGIAERVWLHQLQLTIADIIAEVHDVHHPVGAGDYYEDQKAEAARAAAQFRSERMPKFLAYFEAAAALNPNGWIIDHRWTPVDTSLFQLVEGLRYMFPRRMRALEPELPNLLRLHDQVAQLPGIRAYLKSDRRIAFNEDGIFRHYPELDGPE